MALRTGICAPERNKAAGPGQVLKRIREARLRRKSKAVRTTFGPKDAARQAPRLLLRRRPHTTQAAIEEAMVIFREPYSPWW